MSNSERKMTCDEYARVLVSSVLLLGHRKSQLGRLVKHVVVSVGTARNYQQCVCDFLKWRVAGGYGLEEPVTRSEILMYLRQSSHRWRQKTVDQHRQALSLIFCVAIARFDAEIPTVAVGRAYTREEMELVAKSQLPRNSIATEIAFYSGLRASELLELREGRELDRESNRPWRADLFLGLPAGMIYRTRGKGGLARSVMIPMALHEQLAMRRLQPEVTVVDRKVVRISRFDIGGGQSLSESFSAASKRALGFSLGLHGVRHAYAQRRLETLLELGVDPTDSMEIISQELGHLRPEITLAYTTRRRSYAEEK